MNNKLEKIFNAYNTKYQLKAQLSFNNDIGTKFISSTNCIILDLKKLDIKDLKSRCIEAVKTTKQYQKWALLHEICHVIEWKAGILQQDIKNCDFFLYNNDRKYHHECSFEKRADAYANENIKNYL